MKSKVSQDEKAFQASIAKAAKVIQEYAEKDTFIRVVSHIDADGLAAASIMSLVLHRLGTFFRIRIGKQLDETLIGELTSEKKSLIIFTDLGSGNLDLIMEKLSFNDIIVLDHHEPLDIFFPNLYHINPHLWGFDGSTEISGAGLAYLVSKVLDESNLDLASLAVIGALGDMQDQAEKRMLTGLNETIVKDAINSKKMHVENDLIFYGRETRPVHKALAYTTTPYIPDLSGEEDKCLGFLVNLGIPLKENGRWRSISDLTIEEKQQIFSEITKHLSTRKYPESLALSMIGTVYTLKNEDRWTPLRDAREYSSLLNACGRMNKSGLGVAIGIGDRGVALAEAQTILSEYKKTLAKYLDWLIRTPRNIDRLNNINVIDGSGIIDELMLSVIASIVTSSNFFDDAKPIIALTNSDAEKVKVSGRIPLASREKGLNLGHIFQEASVKFNCRGGGHDVAAGAEFPKGLENEFIAFIDQKIGEILYK